MTHPPDNTTPDANRLAATRERVSAINQELAAIRADARDELLAVLNRRAAIDRELNYLADELAGITADALLRGFDDDMDAGLNSVAAPVSPPRIRSPEYSSGLGCLRRPRESMGHISSFRTRARARGCPNQRRSTTLCRCTDRSRIRR